ncbi:MAG: carbohydrate binding family 9 domain-containing protein [Cyclobacteriaceae bacterium]|nr:carbohydrate binding family 9 domain-containing protein [Cyclobacteriaceae bacterium]UYN85933.1 MAG: carbohydrate binding family 9 domain-containing protein [Cyclobacteriaceae bacterium]
MLFSVLLIGTLSGYAQNRPGMELPIRKALGTITLDGKLDEDDWGTAAVAKDFYLNFPVDTTFAPFQTEARLTFDEHNLYISFVCYDNGTEDIVQSLRRDFDFENNDNMGVYLGPFNDDLNGFYFQITPRGVQSEGLISGGGTGGDSYSDTWDNKWYSHVQRYADRWVAELAIPFKSFRYKGGERQWNITFLRWDRKRNLVSSWVATPIQYIPASFAYGGKLVWVDTPPPSHMNISVIPYVAGLRSVNFEETPTASAHDLSVGFDAKVAITPSLNLDLTVNPDFSQVEVDRQVINLTRFEFRFPELRQFFLENNDLIERAGFPNARPFFTRRVGLARDTSGLIRQVPIAYGARISGSINKNWRINTMNLLTKEKQSLGLPNQLYTVAAVQRNFWKQSNVALLYVEKQSLGIKPADSLRYFNTDLWKQRIRGTDTTRVLNKSNRVLTADLDLLSADNKWYGSFFYSASFDDYLSGKNGAGAAFLRHTTRNYEITGGHTIIQKNFNAEAGFVPSQRVYPGQWSTFVEGTVSMYPSSKTIARMGPFMGANIVGIPDGTVTDQEFNAGYNFDLLNTSSIGVGYGFTYQRLTNTFNPIDGERFIEFQQGETFKWGSFTIEYQSDARKIFNYYMSASYGGFYNGNLVNLNGVLNYRYQPIGSVAVQYDFNSVHLAEGYGKENLFLIGPRVDLTFTDKIFLTTFIQYNNLADNINLNTRFQWRYKPASDFFVVYTENYLPQHLKTKNRALVFKLTYWLNI